jgi:hypothetical protein
MKGSQITRSHNTKKGHNKEEGPQITSGHNKKPGKKQCRGGHRKGKGQNNYLGIYKNEHTAISKQELQQVTRTTTVTQGHNNKQEP